MRALTKRSILVTLFCAMALQTAGCDESGDGEEIKGPVVPALYINELMPANSLTLTDEFGEYDDWVEIYNAGEKDVELTGYYVSDDEEDSFKQRLPAGLTVPGRGVLLLWADKNLEQGPNHLEFKLGKDGEVFLLSTPEGWVVDRVAYGSTSEDVAWARIPDGTGEWGPCWNTTPGASNGNECASVGPCDAGSLDILGVFEDSGVGVDSGYDDAWQWFDARAEDI